MSEYKSDSIAEAIDSQMAFSGCGPVSSNLAISCDTHVTLLSLQSFCLGGIYLSFLLYLCSLGRGAGVGVHADGPFPALGHGGRDVGVPDHEKTRPHRKAEQRESQAGLSGHIQ